MKRFSNAQNVSDTVLQNLNETPFPSDDADRAVDLVRRCPKHAETPLIEAPILAEAAGVGQVFVKDERSRMGLGSFKTLGAAYVIARDAQVDRAAGCTYVTASAGNHGLSVAAGASAFHAHAVVYLAETVPEGFAHRLRDWGAEVRRAGATYEDSMAAAARAATDNGWVLLSDSSWAGYHDRPRTLMEGYLILMNEVVDQMETPPTHIFLQAGVGGLAAACAVRARAAWGRSPRIIVVEPEAASAIFSSIQAGTPTMAPGPVSAMGRLDCKEPSHIALKGLARDADDFITISEKTGQDGSQVCIDAGLETTPSGAAGVAAMLDASSKQDQLGLDETSRVLVFLTEAAGA